MKGRYIMILKPKEMAEKLNVSVKTLQSWDNDGTLVAYRNPKNRLYYTTGQLNEYLGLSEQHHRKIVAYCRVSNKNQNDDLENQVKFIQNHVNGKGLVLDEIISDIGSGLNYKRKKWNQLLDDVMNNEIDAIYITYKDRFIRFGYEWFESLCHKFNTKIIVLNNKTTSPRQELVENLIAIIHVFSCRIYGLRKYKKKIQKDDEL